MPISIIVNGKRRQVDVDDDTPLLWVLRDVLGLTGTKFGCGIAACGACTVHVDGKAVRSCVLPLRAVKDASITTIEGLVGGDETHALRRLWIEHQVPQCGYCQPGMIMAISAFLDANQGADVDQLSKAITNICRCGSYPRILKAVRALHREASSGPA